MSDLGTCQWNDSANPLMWVDVSVRREDIKVNKKRFWSVLIAPTLLAFLPGKSETRFIFVVGPSKESE